MREYVDVLFLFKVTWKFVAFQANGVLEISPVIYILSHLAFFLLHKDQLCYGAS
jgi:hypothetical protein